MKDCTQALLDLIPNPKAINARATFRVMRPQFATSVITDNLAITDSTLIDSCAFGTGILRVTNYNGYLYTQNVLDVHAATWGNWVNKNIALVAGSRPGVDGGYVWYQKASSPGELYYRNFASWSTEVLGRGDGDGYPEILAPIRNERCYSMFTVGDAVHFNFGEAVSAEKFWYTRPERLYGVTDLRIDAVNYSDDAINPVDYVYFSDRDAGRIVEMRVVPNSDSESDVEWGQPRPIIAIDAIDEVYGLNLHGAEMIDGKVVVTGRLTRTSDGNPVSMDVYTFGPEDFSLGRDMFISQTNIGSKIMVAGTELVAAGASYCASAIGTNLFGVDNEVYKLVSSDIGHLQLQEAENRSSTASLSLSSSLSHVAISRGAHVEIEVAYNDEWMKVLTGEVARVARTRGEGESLTVDIANLTAKRLSQWSPDQGIYVPSQSYTVCHASDLSKVIRADGKFAVSTPYATAGKYDDTDSRWTYSGTWGTDTPAGAYNNTIHYNNAPNTTDSASFDFVGTGFIFTYTKYSDRGLHDIWVDGVKIATVDAYNVTKIQGTYTSPALDPGLHTFKVTHGSPVSGYIDVDAIEILGSANDLPLQPSEFNKLSVLYTVARASRGGIMRAKFWNETASDLTTRNPRFGVGLNYRRESKVEAAARLDLEYTDVDDDMCGHNGIVAIYSRDEANGNAGIALYRWENSVLTRLTYYAFTLSTGDVWIQMRHIEGRTVVHTRGDADTSWTQRLVWLHSSSPWLHEDGGHGCAVMERRLTRSLQYYGFSESDTTIAVEPHSALDASGQILVDDEIVAYSGKSTYNSSSPNASYPGTFPHIMPYRWFLGDSAFSGKFLPVWSNLHSVPDNSFVGAAAALYGDGYARTSRITAFDNGQTAPWPQSWSPATGIYTPGWANNVGNTSAGSWVHDPSMQGVYTVEDLNSSLPGYADPIGMPYVPGVDLRIKPGLYVSGRGQNDTAAATHTGGLIYQYVDIQLSVDQIEFYSQEEDITLADALRRVLNLAGGSIAEKRLVDTPYLTKSHTVLGSDWKVLDIDDGKKDFVAEIHISKSTLHASQSIQVGMAFYNEIPTSVEFSEGFLILVERNFLTLYNANGNSLEIVERIYPITGDRFVGVLRISVQDNRFAVWLNHKLLHVFYRDTFSLEAYQYKGFVMHNPLGAYVTGMRYLYSELNDLMADIVVGTRGKGMAILGELTGNRRVYFRSEPDGSLYFYKTMSDVGNLPDIVVSEQREEVDELASRVRIEGIKIAEIADFAVLASTGNLFETINSMYAETVQDLVADGEKVIEQLRQRSDTRSLETVFHPALQPGDAGVIDIAGAATNIGIMATGVTFGFNGENFDVNAGIEVYIT